MKKLTTYLFFLLLITLSATFFLRSNYKSVSEIDSQLLKDPIQEVSDSAMIKTENESYSLSLDPLYEYEINGLLVHKYDYRIFSISKKDSLFPMDLCLIWGDNVKDQAYRGKSVKFDQDMRWCFVRWGSGDELNLEDFSNSHLILSDNELLKKVKRLSPGDQIKIKGKLVNVQAEAKTAEAAEELPNFQLETSTVRDDTGAGACEIIYVESIEILKKGNPFLHNLFSISYFGVMGIVILRVAFALPSLFKREEETEEV